MPAMNTKNLIILAVVVLVTLKFRNELLGVFAKVPVVNTLLA